MVKDSKIPTENKILLWFLFESLSRHLTALKHKLCHGFFTPLALQCKHQGENNHWLINFCFVGPFSCCSFKTHSKALRAVICPECVRPFFCFNAEQDGGHFKSPFRITRSHYVHLQERFWASWFKLIVLMPCW